MTTTIDAVLRAEVLRIIETYKVSVGNSTAGEIACEMTMANLKDIRAAVRALAPTPAVQAEADADFKNFHRLLCERFDYVHDERDWKRDQLSLIEHIATRSALAAAPAAIDKQEAVAWFIADDNGEVYRATGYEHERDQWRAVGHEVFPLYAAPLDKGASKPVAPVTVYPQGVMGIPPYSPPASGSMTVEPGLSWNASPAAPSVAQDDKKVDDLAMLVKKLVRHVRKVSPDNNMAVMAMDYLQRKGLAGSPLRAEASADAQDDATDYEALEREHLGDADKRTGIYAPKDAQDERGAFEACLKAGVFDAERLSDFHNCETEAAWRGWQARAASTSANVAQGAEAIYQVFLRGLKVYVDTTKEAYDNNLRTCPEDVRIVYAAPPAQTSITDDAREIAATVKDLIECLMLWNGQASAGLDVKFLAGLRDGLTALTAEQPASGGEHD